MGLGGSERGARTCPTVTQWGVSSQVLLASDARAFHCKILKNCGSPSPQLTGMQGTDWHQNEGATAPPTPSRALSLQCHHQIHSQTPSPLLRFLLCLFLPFLKSSSLRMPVAHLHSQLLEPTHPKVFLVMGSPLQTFMKPLWHLTNAFSF